LNLTPQALTSISETQKKPYKLFKQITKLFVSIIQN